MMREHYRQPKWDSESCEKITRLLQFRMKDGKPSAMKALGSLYPCRTLPRAATPRA